MIAKLSQLLSQIESGFGKPNALVVGDLMLDKFVWGEVERISQEAPVPVLRTSRYNQQPGGAGNVAMNLAGLGANVTVMGFGGGDDDQHSLESLLEQAGVEHAIVACPRVPTTSQLRVLAGHQQLLRMDSEPKLPDFSDASESLLRHVLPAIAGSSVIVLSDHAKGVLNEPISRTIVDRARKAHVPVVVNSKGKDFTRYRGATVICLNARELAEATGASASDLKWLLSTGQSMVASLNLQYMLLTLGEKGITILRQDSCHNVPTTARQVFDVSGAGDTVTAVVAAAIAAGMPMEPAVELANAAAGIVIGKAGTAPIQPEELLGSLPDELETDSEDKITPLEPLLGRIAGWRARGFEVVLTNGCFDRLHVGHIRLLEQARRMGDRLIVAVNSDRSVRELKGSRRPWVRQQDRVKILAALTAVDAVVVFDERTPLRLIEAIRPDVLVKGGDYLEDEVVGAAEVRGWGGRLELVPKIADRSTTHLVERSRAPAGEGT
jgi:D-beta-D-heptose 7-phosphate kinase/D-beta-D-heptose 1-phosphate adenosyltransferase